ncbi:MAG: GNAT family N-acetyltransferase [Actinobacteria bacterium]|nr:GNAT family N-acetyltransferase [Actinomycetota bacterium]
MNAWRLPPDGLPLPDPPLVGEPGILLRPWVGGDAPALAAAWADPEIARRLPVPDDPSPGRAVAWIAGDDERRRLGLALDLVVVDADDRVLGEVGLSSFDADRGAALIGWWTMASARGRGVASAAAGLVTNWGHDGLGLSAVVAQIGPDNPASVRVAERAGFRELSGRTGAWVANIA